MDVADEPFDIALDCSGRARAMETALGLLGRGGALVLVGSGLPRPRFNRIAMSLPAERLDAEHRRQIVDFYHRVSGLREYEMMTEDHKQLVLGAYTAEQFVFPIADDAPMRCPRLDHFGLSVGSEEELDELLARCRAYQRQEDRADIIDKRIEDHGVLKVTGFYARYLLPLMVEVQYFDDGEGGGPGPGSTGAGGEAADLRGDSWQGVSRPPPGVARNGVGSGALALRRPLDGETVPRSPARSLEDGLFATKR